MKHLFRNMIHIFHSQLILWLAGGSFVGGAGLEGLSDKDRRARKTRLEDPQGAGERREEVPVCAESNSLLSAAVLFVLPAYQGVGMWLESVRDALGVESGGG